MHSLKCNKKLSAKLFLLHDVARLPGYAAQYSDVIIKATNVLLLSHDVTTMCCIARELGNVLGAAQMIIMMRETK